MHAARPRFVTRIFSKEPNRERISWGLDTRGPTDQTPIYDVDPAEDAPAAVDE